MKEELHYGYKKIIYEDGSVKYFDITTEQKKYREITKKEAAILESKVLNKIDLIRKKNYSENKRNSQKALQNYYKRKNENTDSKD